MGAFKAYGRDGAELSDEEFLVRFGDPKYQVLAQTRVGAYTVSTVWLGITHGRGSDGRPVVFESMVFSSADFADPSGSLSDIDTRRYTSEADAFAGHTELVTVIRATMLSDLGSLVFEASEEPVELERP
jgi:hypothetical protein